MRNQKDNTEKRLYLIPLVIIVLAAATLCFSLTRQKASEGEGPDYETVQRGNTTRYVDPDTKAFMDDAAAVYDDVMDQKVGEPAFDMRVQDESGEISHCTESSNGSTAETAKSTEEKTDSVVTPVTKETEQPADSDYMPGRYMAKDPSALGGNSSSEFYVELNKDHTGTISLQDQIPIAWYSEEGVILNADTGEQIFEFSVEGDLLTLIDSAENGGASFEFERE